MRSHPTQGTACTGRGGEKGYRDLWRAGQALLGDLDLPRPFSVGALCDTVRRTRGRRLIVLPLPQPTSDESPYGLWVEYPDADFILHEAGTSPAHRDQIILHEIAHILLGHSAGVSLPDISNMKGRGLVSRLNSGQAMMMSRHSYGNTEERHAEIVASVLIDRNENVQSLAVYSSAYDYMSLHVLWPLWSALTAEAPCIVLSPSPDCCGDPLVRGAELRFRLRRRIVEIRDAALLLRGYVSDARAAAAHDTLGTAGLAGEELDAAAEAAWLRAACASRRAGCTPTRPAPLRRLRGSGDLTGEARRLQLVTAAWNHPAVGAVAESMALSVR